MLAKVLVLQEHLMQTDQRQAHKAVGKVREKYARLAARRHQPAGNLSGGECPACWRSPAP